MPSGAIADLVAVFRYQTVRQLFSAARRPTMQSTLDLAPCGSGGRLERQKLPERNTRRSYGGWSDGLSTLLPGLQGQPGAR